MTSSEIDTIENINRSLVKLGADPAAIDVSRLLRLPGFKHMKYRAEGQTPLVTATISGHRYEVAELQQAFPPVNKISKALPPTARAANNAPPIDPALTGKIIADVKNKAPDLWRGQWELAVARQTGQAFASQSQADIAQAGHIVRSCRAVGVPEQGLSESVEYIFGQSALAQRDKWINRPAYRASTIAAAITGSPLQSVIPLAVTAELFESHGDIRNAKAFASKWRGKLLFVVSRSVWLRWDEERWQLCEKDEQITYAKEVCAAMLNAASASYQSNPDKGKKLIQDAVASHNLPKIHAMLKLAVSEPGMAVTERELDADPLLLGVRNGVVDLKTSHYFLNQPEFLVNRYCNADYIDDAPRPRWRAFLYQIFEEDEETIESVQRLLGYTLTGLVTEEVLVICYGFGSNGKSVFSNVVHKILAGYATTAPPSLLTARRSDDTSPRNDLAALSGARYVSINELQAGDRLDEQVVKMLAGREPISARFLHREYFEYMPSFTAWLRTNHKPIITGGDDGIWRRLVILPFRRKFTDDEKDPFLEGKLLDERDGILQWMLEGTRKYFKDGLKLSPRILNEIATYRKDSDLLGEFLDDAMEADAAAKLNQQTAYQAWNEWCKNNGFRVSSKKSFTQRLAERGFPEGKSGGNRFYVGLKTQSKKALTLTPSTQGRVDRISAVLPISKNIESHEEITGNSENPAQPALESGTPSTDGGGK